jgi:cytochrome c biogenesis protein CcdA
MTNNRNFWYALMGGAVLFYIAAAVLALRGQPYPRTVYVALILLGLHVLEIPLAFNKLKGMNPQPLRLLLMTVLFGLLWWVPARRGLLAVR